MMEEGFANDFLMDWASHHWGGNDDYDYIHQRLMWRPERWFFLEIMHQTSSDQNWRFFKDVISFFFAHPSYTLKAMSASARASGGSGSFRCLASRIETTRTSGMAVFHLMPCLGEGGYCRFSVDVDEDGRWAVSNFTRFRWELLVVYHLAEDL